MSAPNARQSVQVQAVTADEVDGLWHQATKEGPYPHTETNELIAQMMNGYRAVPGIRPNGQIINAVDLLLTACQDSWTETEDGRWIGDEDYYVLEKALTKIRPTIVIEQQCIKNYGKWHLVAGTVFWSCASGVLEELGRTAGTSRNSVAVQFAALAMERMGWMGCGPAGLEAFLARAPKATKSK